MAAVVLPFIPRFVTPNQVTVLRFLLIPFVAWTLIQGNYAVGVPLFIFASCTDALDGSLARMRKRVTRWGTFYDPVADKLLVGTAVLIMVARYLSAWFAAVIVFIELLIGIGGYVHRHEGKMQSANAWGKAKMFFQFSGLTVLLFSIACNLPLLIPISVGLLAIGILLAVISLFTYGL